MTEITIWILIAISAGSHNRGTSTVIDRFASEQTCKAALIQAYPDKDPFAGARIARCVKATVVREKGQK